MVYALGLDMIARVAFDTFGVEDSTNWCIFVHFFDYIAWAAVYMHVSQLIGFIPLRLNSLFQNDKVRKAVWYISLATSIYYSAHAFIQLTYINEQWSIYNEGTFQEGYELPHSLAIIAGVSLFYYLRFLKKKVAKYKWV